MFFNIKDFGATNIYYLKYRLNRNYQSLIYHLNDGLRKDDILKQIHLIHYHRFNLTFHTFDINLPHFFSNDKYYHINNNVPGNTEFYLNL